MDETAIGEETRRASVASARGHLLAMRRALGRVLRRLGGGCLDSLRWLRTRTGRSKLARRADYLTKPAGLAVVNGDRESYVLDTRDKTIGKTLFEEGEFDLRKVYQAFALSGFASEKALFVDVGANIGSICIPVVKRGLAARALAIEPEPGNLRLLRMNTILNGVEDRVTVIERAASDRPDQPLEMEISPVNLGDHRVRTERRPGRYGEETRRTVVVRSTTLDAELDGHGTAPPFLWIDTQGFEAFVLEGAARTLARTPPVVIEFWPYGLERTGSRERLLATILGTLYDRLYDLGEPEPVPRPVDRATLTALAERYGPEARFTDILLVAEGAP